MKFTLLLSFILSLTTVFGQTRIRGKVTDGAGQPLFGVNILEKGTTNGTYSGKSGNFEIEISEASAILVFSFVGYQTLELSTESLADNSVVLIEDETLLDQVEVDGQQVSEDPAIVQEIDARSANLLPSAFGEFSQVLATLPGVSTNNELASTYSVRGGNFEENLVYVDNIPIYRPFLANSGRQEGLSFVNSDLIRNISFYAGGWAPRYGDKLSSSLNIEYKKPSQREGNVTLGLLGGSAYVGGANQSKRVNYVVGLRHRDSRYLLRTLEVDGQYFPQFTDIQSFITFDLSRKESNEINRTTLSVLSSYSRNRYLTLPANGETEFGSAERNFRLQTAFVGREELNYDTFQGGANLSHRWSNRFRSNLIISGVYTREQENYEIEGAYRLCDVDNNPNSNSFNDCVVTRGVGTNYSYGRNRLVGTIGDLQLQNQLLINDFNNLQFGVGLNYSDLIDELNEFAFTDSSDFVTITESTFNELGVTATQTTGFIQNTTFTSDSSHVFTYGVRFNYWDWGDEWIISPRLQYLYRLSDRTNIRFATGLYAQPAFYRELRDRDGELVDDLESQKSWHFILGVEQGLNIGRRKFRLTGEVYWKEMWDIVPYDVENIRLRYFANNDAAAVARGVDFRINGEFIAGTQSWFSVGLLETNEDILGDGRAEIRRPTDQRMNIGAYFEDHIPKDPSIRVYLNMNIGSGYPFGPPNSSEFRNAFSGDEYYRVDLGLSKEFNTSVFLGSSALLRIELLNALGADNTLSYIWIEDVTGASFAVPNSLSARFLNIKLTTKF